LGLALSMQQINIKVPAKLAKVPDADHRIIVLFGGRGGGKSVTVTDVILRRMMTRQKYKVLALREFMNSISDSMHSMFESRINHFGWGQAFKVTNNTIEGSHEQHNVSVIYGQLARNVESLKSKADIDLAVVEEAETVSERSIEVLEPTIRAEGSQILYLLNPKDEDGAVYKRYIHPYLKEIDKQGFYESQDHGGLLVIKINLSDNPFAPQELLDDSARMQKDNPKKWRHVYGGEILLPDDDDNLINPDLVIPAAYANNVPEQGPLIIGVDPARFGKDQTAIIRRKGRAAYNLSKLDNIDTMSLAGRLALIIKVENPDMIFIDVGGLGVGIYDRLVELGYGNRVKAVNFGGKAMQSDRYLNKRAEIWDLMKQWLDDSPVSIPNDAGLIRDLVTPKFKIKSTGQIQLESKDDMKKRLGRSTDAGDALALTFAFPVATRAQERKLMDEISAATFSVGDSTAGY